MAEKKLHTEKDAAEILEVGRQTLANWRHLRRGPAYIKIGKAIRYANEDLRRYIEENRVDPLD